MRRCLEWSIGALHTRYIYMELKATHQTGCARKRIIYIFKNYCVGVRPRRECDFRVDFPAAVAAATGNGVVVSAAVTVNHTTTVRPPAYPETRVSRSKLSEWRVFRVCGENFSVGTRFI